MLISCRSCKVVLILPRIPKITICILNFDFRAPLVIVDINRLIITD